MTLLRTALVIGLSLGVSAVCTAAPGAAHAQGRAPEGPVRISGGVMAVQLLYKVDPAYPPDARAAGLEGVVTLHVIVGKDGTVQAADVVAGAEELGKSAVYAVKQWRYKPYLLNGNPVAVDTVVTVRFSKDQPKGS